ncbi:hypothetical protein RQM47_00490 [Rubrivirga sp. S365]|uniref:SusD family protein n=1 Tax=Rubrivirga litoralis TaxID=3075598 RepID=A0ABU3BU62_9BACT|nr:MULTISPECIES: hypothetical protein [unclassified Rubrivirga]MDT0632835.1 hypothetical protein [Rubrivirga sp. F394]MDT7855113.1 hypothetical protein [Rubrivirga sp. S365]
MNKSLLISVVAGALAVSGCDSFVNDVDPPIDLVSSDSLNAVGNLQFVVTGVEQRFATAYGDIVVLSEGLADSYRFAYGTSGATFPTYIEIDEGMIELDNNSVDAAYTDVNELRFLADDLINRVTNTIQFGSNPPITQSEALYAGNLYAGIARYFLATYFGLNPRQGGATIDSGPFIPSSELYDQAIANFQAALSNVDAGSYEARVANSLLARAYLYAGNTEQAGSTAGRGLIEGDADFAALFSPQTANPVWLAAGRGRTQYGVDPRFEDNEITPTEEYETVDCADTPYCADGDLTYGRQAEYLTDSDPIPFITWQETNLIRAESLLGSDDSQAVGLINAAYDGNDISSIDRNTLIEIRDDLLFSRGARLVDQRRFDLWHLGPDTWQYLPITQTERNGNPNID